MLTVNNQNIVNKINKVQLSGTSDCHANLKTPVDSVSFTGLVIKPTKNTAEIDKLINTFFDSLTKNLEPDKNTSGLLYRIGRYISTYPFRIVAKKPNSINEIVKVNNKIAGGYSISINPSQASAHIGFITLAPEFMKTKTGIQVLKAIGKQICANLEVNNVKELTWSTNSKNTQINKLLKRFNAQKVRDILSESEYKISIEDFKTGLGIK